MADKYNMGILKFVGRYNKCLKMKEVIMWKNKLKLVETIVSINICFYNYYSQMVITFWITLVKPFFKMLVVVVQCWLSARGPA